MEKLILGMGEELTLDREVPCLCLVKKGGLQIKQGTLKVGLHEHFGTLECMVKTKGLQWRVTSAEGAEV